MSLEDRTHHALFHKVTSGSSRSYYTDHVTYRICMPYCSSLHYLWCWFDGFDCLKQKRPDGSWEELTSVWSLHSNLWMSILEQRLTWCLLP